MNLRSRGPSNLVPIVADIRALERECARARREEEHQAHLDIDMADPPQGAEHQPQAARPIGAYDRPNIHGHRLGIQAPAVAANNFEGQVRTPQRDREQHVSWLGSRGPI